MIPIKNIYYMLSYAFTILKQDGYEKLGKEEFEHIEDFMSSIMIKGLNMQLKRGLFRTYNVVDEDTVLPHGKINISNSIKRNLIIKHKLNCEYDEFSIDNKLNQIIKKALMLLIKMDISNANKKELNKILIHFKDVKLLDNRNINYNVLFNKNNENYKLLIYISSLIITSSIQSNDSNGYNMPKIFDEQHLYVLFENFVREYYKQNYSNVKVSKSKIKWFTESYPVNLPNMITDITLEYNNKVLIIDTKYYAKSMSTYYNKRTYNSANLYQIFTYVKNKQSADKNVDVNGMLLYAKTDEKTSPDDDYLMDGNTISVKSLDLNQDFIYIENQLKNIINTYLINK